jgi:hypothetical protein
VSRLWSRSGLRVLSIMVLLFGLLGGGVLHFDRQTQQRATIDAAQSRLALSYQQRFEQQQAAVLLATAPQRAAIAAAQAEAAKKAATTAAANAAKAKAAQDAARKAHANTASRSSTRTADGPVPTSCSTYSGNRAIGCTILVSSGFGLDQMPCLDKMWTKESNWRTTAENPSSKSYGIPQALPASKMAVFGSDYRTNPATQIKWGLDYIEKRYKSPCGAWDFWQGHNWY